MQPWQLAFLGQHELPRELTAFELRYFFSFNDAERRAIRTRRRPLNQLGSALHLGFMKMSGCALDVFEMVPRSLLTHLGRELGIDVPTVTSVRALYRRRATLFEHQRWAAEILGFSPTSEHQRRALTGLIKQESYKGFLAQTADFMHLKKGASLGPFIYQEKSDTCCLTRRVISI